MARRIEIFFEKLHDIRWQSRIVVDRSVRSCSRAALKCTYEIAANQSIARRLHAVRIHFRDFCRIEKITELIKQLCRFKFVSSVITYSARSPETSIDVLFIRAKWSSLTLSLCQME